MREHWEAEPVEFRHVPELLNEYSRRSRIKEPPKSARDAEFDGQPNLQTVRIGCVPERMRFTVTRIVSKPNQPMKIVFQNEDATDHNWVLVEPGALEEVGIAANEMARDPKNAQSDFLPPEKRDRILQASPMIGPTRKARIHVLRFMTPQEPGVYPFVCTFPGHWIMMRGDLVIASSTAEAEAMLASVRPQIVKKWELSDFADNELAQMNSEERTLMRGMQAFMKARCHQCHAMSGHGVPLGPDLTKTKARGRKLLQQILEPSSEINSKFQTHRLLLASGKTVTGVIVKEEDEAYHIVRNLLTPNDIVVMPKKEVERKQTSKVSPMPVGLADVLSKEEILDLLSFIESGGYQLPHHLKNK